MNMQKHSKVFTVNRIAKAQKTLRKASHMMSYALLVLAAAKQ